MQCRLAALRHGEYLQNYYLKKGPEKDAGKTIIATARKFLGVICRTLENKRAFADFPDLVLAEG